ncbi:MAG: ATP-dependent DNA ligase [Candidatus Freyarchaeota archaeon]|nr:ATP-dependent DNA ligase [Candidatus Jordarchaeia archaeon]
MLFSKIADFYEKIEATTKRLEMIDLLVNLFSETPRDIIDKVVYLTTGRLYPLFVPVELGVSEKLAMRSIAMVAGVSPKEVEGALKETGDLGLVAEAFMKKKRQASLFHKPLTVETVYETLDKIARESGEGSVEAKLKHLSKLLLDGTPKEDKYIIRIVIGTLRLGIADYTILDALAVAFTGSRDNRPVLERAYNITSDLGLVAKVAATEGLESLRNFKVTVGKPVRMMLAQRASSPEEILERMGGRCSAEYKLDGERMQIHKDGDKVDIFSRRLENITYQYPDIVKLIVENLTVKRAIIEGECVAINPDTGEMLPFQQLMRRRRVYGIEEAMEKYPAMIYLFDALLIEDEDLTGKPYPERRRRLAEITRENERIKLVKAEILDNVEAIERFFDAAVEDGCEGIMAKSIQQDSIYEAGSRGYKWLKFKREYKTEMTDTIDAVIVGAYMGKGRRAGSYGALLVAVYDDDSDTFKTICKVGTGFSDEELESLPEMLKPYQMAHKHPRVDSKLKADVWFTPAKVIEIIGAELTVSQVHTCALGYVKEDSGIAIRFPRFTGKWRDDKGPEEATTVREIIEMYEQQKK